MICARTLATALLFASLATVTLADPPRRVTGDSAAETFFSEPTLRAIELNPSGTHAAAHALYSGSHGILIQELATGAVEPVFLTEEPIVFGWIDSDTIAVLVEGKVRPRTRLVELTQRESGLDFEVRRVRAKGLPDFTGMLASTDDTLLWSTYTDGSSFAYRVPTDELVEPHGKERLPDRKYQVAHSPGMVLKWVSDRNGVMRAALTRQDSEDSEFALRYRDDAESKWRELGRWDDEEDVAIPVGLASNDHDLLVLSRNQRDTRALLEYHVDDPRFGRVIYADPGTDVSGVLYDFHGAEVQAAVYERNGLRRYHHLSEFGTQQQQWLDERFPGQSVAVTSVTRDRTWLSILVTGPRNPGNFYVVRTKDHRVVDIGKAMPQLNPSVLVDVRFLKVESGDGTQVEAYLALPLRFEGDRPPLVVMPHGGPIGVRDDRDFNPLVQYLAASGFAVLTVNYRGSDGYGRAFLNAGRRQWAKGIEGDIDAAVVRVIADGVIDPKRVCISGASYGGYSALISVTQYPDRYRCAASLAAPTDVLLLFESSDFAATEDGRREMARIVGDPETESEHLVDISPAYRAADIDVPVFIAHAENDRRVDIEHAYRMKAMLEANEKDVEWMVLRETGHSPSREELVRYVKVLRRFFELHLNR